MTAMHRYALICKKFVFVCVHTSTFFFSFALLLFSVFPFLSPLSSSLLAYTYSSSLAQCIHPPSSFRVFLRATHTLTNEEPECTWWLIYTVILCYLRNGPIFLFIFYASENVESIQRSKVVSKLVSLRAN